MPTRRHILSALPALALLLTNPLKIFSNKPKTPTYNPDDLWLLATTSITAGEDYVPPGYHIYYKDICIDSICRAINIKDQWAECFHYELDKEKGTPQLGNTGWANLVIGNGNLSWRYSSNDNLSDKLVDLKVDKAPLGKARTNSIRSHREYVENRKKTRELDRQIFMDKYRATQLWIGPNTATPIADFGPLLAK